MSILRLLLGGALFLYASLLAAQCTAGFVPIIWGDSASFQNNSTVSNARYYWDLGLGIGSSEENPSFIYPDDGLYEVTLYAQDTLSGCVDVFSTVLQVSTPDSFVCDLNASSFFTDANGTTFMTTTDLSMNCPPFAYIDCDAAQQENAAWSIVVGDTNLRASFLSRIQYIDTVAGAYDVRNEFYRNIPLRFDPATTNYGPCSANFEVYETINPPTQFNFDVSAMNRAGNSYSWRFQRNSLVFSTATGPDAGFFTPPPFSTERADFYLITLIVEDSVNGCTDSLTRQIALRNTNFQPILEVETVELAEEWFELYPNPSEGPVRLRLREEAGAPAQVQVVDGTGKVQRQSVLEGMEMDLDLAGLPAGLYLVGVQMGERRMFKRLLLRR